MLSGCFNLLALRTILNVRVTKIRVGIVRQQSNCLAILVVLLDAPCDPNKVGNVKRRIINNLQLAFRFVQENKVLSGKCFYDLAARWVNVVFDL
jgi:hypothetical protein